MVVEVGGGNYEIEMRYLHRSRLEIGGVLKILSLDDKWEKIRRDEDSRSTPSGWMVSRDVQMGIEVGVRECVDVLEGCCVVPVGFLDTD